MQKIIRKTIVTDKMKHNIEYKNKIDNILKKNTKTEKPPEVPLGRCAVCFRTIWSAVAHSYYEFRTSKKKSYKKCHDSCAQHKGLKGVPNHIVNRRKNKYKNKEE